MDHVLAVVFAVHATPLAEEVIWILFFVLLHLSLGREALKAVFVGTLDGAAHASHNAVSNLNKLPYWCSCKRADIYC
jgi:hypothetical protein